MKLRPAATTDADAIAALAVQLGYPVAPDVMAQRLANLPQDSEIVVVATIDAQVLAWMQLGVAHSIESTPFVEIRGLVVNADHRDQGIGAALVAFASEWTAARGYTALRVRSNTVRAATHAFYQKRGFAVIKEQKVFSLNITPAQESS